MSEAYPLAWPDGWPRTPVAERKNGDTAFKRQVEVRSQHGGGYYKTGRPWTFAQARDALLEEVFRHGAVTCVISSNFPVSKNGSPLEGRRRPEEEGVAIYFQRKGKPYVMACDRYHDAEQDQVAPESRPHCDCWACCGIECEQSWLSRIASGVGAVPAPRPR